METTPIRLAVSGVIEREAKLLLVEFDDPIIGTHVTLPGGGVETGEALRDAVRREVREETGLDVIVGDLLLVCELLPHPERPDLPHTISLVFRCVASAGATPYIADGDTYQIGLRWASPDALEDLGFVPLIAPRLRDALTGAAHSAQVFTDVASPDLKVRRDP